MTTIVMNDNQITSNKVCILFVNGISCSLEIDLIRSIGGQANSSTNQRSFGLDESYPPSDQRWRPSATSALSPESSESRLTTGDTGEIC